MLAAAADAWFGAGGAGGLAAVNAPSPPPSGVPLRGDGALQLLTPASRETLDRASAGMEVVRRDWATLLREAAQLAARRCGGQVMRREQGATGRGLDAYTLAMSANGLGVMHLIPFNAQQPGIGPLPAAAAAVPARRGPGNAGDGGWLCSAGHAAVHTVYITQGEAVLLPPTPERRELAAFPRADAAVWPQEID
eukprot:gene10158-9968_t